MHIVSPDGRADDPAGGAAVRIVIAEDSVLLRAGPDPPAGRRRRRGRGHGRRRRRAADRGRAPPARPGGGRRAHAADVHRRRAAGRAADPGPLARRSASSCCRSTSRRATPPSCWPTTPTGLGYLLKDRIADVAEFLDGVRRVGEGGTALDPEVVAQLLARTPPARPARPPVAPRARGARPDGRGPHERGHRPRARRQRRRGREARQQHLHQARPAARPRATTAGCSPCCGGWRAEGRGGATVRAADRADRRRFADRVCGLGRPRCCRAAPSGVLWLVGGARRSPCSGSASAPSQAASVVAHEEHTEVAEVDARRPRQPGRRQRRRVGDGRSASTGPTR